MVKLAPSLLAADFADMKKGIALAEEVEGDYLHCDVMDGVFVPNISFGLKMIEDIKKRTDIPLDVHLMIANPDDYAERFARAGADMITFHVEATQHIQRVLSVIRDCGIGAGVALNPATPLETVKYILDDVDMILLMSVNPGFGGQSFIPAVKGKITELRGMIMATRREIDIEVDGGISAANAQEIARAGASVLVAGSAIFEADDPVAAAKAIRE
jgi:ribulose-phosphate 3-epimerase